MARNGRHSRKSSNPGLTVIPAKAGIQGGSEHILDSRFRGNDGKSRALIETGQAERWVAAP